jgi:CHAD domain-containing protein
MSASTERYDLLHKRLEQFTRMLHGLEKGDAQALHRTRIASRRLREVLPILQLDAEVTRKLSRRLRKVTRRLGTVRELDVLLLLIDGLHESGRHNERSLKRLATAVSEERTEARERLLARLPATELHRIGDKLDTIARELKAHERTSPARGRSGARRSRWAVEARLARRASALATAIRDAGAVYLPERLHVVRIALKKLRYAVEVSAEIALAPVARANPNLRTLKHGQDVLGRLHDVQVLIDRVRQLQAPLAPSDITVWRELDTVVTSLENDCRRLHARYMRARPALLALCNRVGARPAASAMRRRA